MPRKKKAPVESPVIALPQDLLEQLILGVAAYLLTAGPFTPTYPFAHPVVHVVASML